MTRADACEAADVDDRPLERAWREAEAERVVDGGWEPPEVWAAVRAGRRRRLVLTVLCGGVVAVTLSLGLRGLGRGDWGAAALWFLVLGAPVVRLAQPLLSGSRRSRWETDVRARISDEHARAAAAVPDCGRPKQP